MIENPSIGATPALVNQLIRTRRSVFTQQFEPGKAIPDEVIRQVLKMPIGRLPTSIQNPGVLLYSAEKVAVN
ncbi:hypothetical protein [Paraflavitalea speifideaquila]|uniref:hypothetical protein n=1 Tax=Paraflavitalea speifideaquila TaxID=3076558 RepID=UPI0028E27279|nr:hypothetical protein [Paraflavitalea speifideiaquila]